ncbi:MAG: hypothetical protein KA004_01325 [Verrucomicrobiales bacterium]|nr:hypothetical protein [Verrucomicrobiales bacterium]
MENINKRYLCGILAFNLSLLMRKLIGVGTTWQIAAAGRAVFGQILAVLVSSSKPNGLEPGQVEWGDLIGWERGTVAGWSQAPRRRYIPG